MYLIRVEQAFKTILQVPTSPKQPHATGVKFETPPTVMVNGTKPTNTPNLVCPTSSPSLSSPSPIDSMNPSQEVPVNVSPDAPDATDASEKAEHSRPPAPTSTATGAESAEHPKIYKRTTRQQADARLRTRSEPNCKPDSSNIIETESQKSSPSKRLRTTFTPHQTALLEKKYALNSKPSREIRLEIAQELRLWVPILLTMKQRQHFYLHLLNVEVHSRSIHGYPVDYPGSSVVQTRHFCLY